MCKAEWFPSIVLRVGWFFYASGKKKELKENMVRAAVKCRSAVQSELSFILYRVSS